MAGGSPIIDGCCSKVFTGDCCLRLIGLAFLSCDCYLWRLSISLVNKSDPIGFEAGYRCSVARASSVI